jgi:hypothetical protein
VSLPLEKKEKGRKRTRGIKQASKKYKYCVRSSGSRNGELISQASEKREE